jgi:glutathione S-transferase
MTLVHIVIALGLIEFFVFLMAVGRARGTYQLPAPATSGNEMFERYFRVQMNTIEQLVIFLPSILLFARYVHPLIAAALGLVFVIGRSWAGSSAPSSGWCAPPPPEEARAHRFRRARGAPATR